MIEVSVIPMVGFVPFSHMGHYLDLGKTLENAPGLKYLGLSRPSCTRSFGFDMKKEFLLLQWQMPKLNVFGVSSPGEMIGRVHQVLSAYDDTVNLTMVVGHDRLKMAEGLRNSLEHNEIHEMHGFYYNQISIKMPPHGRETHGLSGTKMRQAALDNDFLTFHKHIGLHIDPIVTRHMMTKVQRALMDDEIHIKRR